MLSAAGHVPKSHPLISSIPRQMREIWSVYPADLTLNGRTDPGANPTLALEVTAPASRIPPNLSGRSSCMVAHTDMQGVHHQQNRLPPVVMQAACRRPAEILVARGPASGLQKFSHTKAGWLAGTEQCRRTTRPAPFRRPIFAALQPAACSMWQVTPDEGSAG